MVGQEGYWFGARNMDGSQGSSMTIQVRNRNLSAEVALYDVWVIDDVLHWPRAYISQIVSDNGVEHPGPGTAIAFRANVTSITFRVEVINCAAAARCMINFWS